MLSPFPRVPTPHRRRVTVVTRLCDRGRPICHFYAIAGMRHPGPLTAIDYGGVVPTGPAIMAPSVAAANSPGAGGWIVG